MERLTYWNEEYGCWSYRCPSGDAAKRLAAYEDTGLTPEEIKKAFNEEAVLKLAAQALGTTPERLREMAKARDEGRVVALPCKAGDVIYSLRWNVKTEQYDIRSGKVKNVRYDLADDIVTVSDGEYLKALGKTAFLTRAEAEAALGGGGDGA